MNKSTPKRLYAASWQVMDFEIGVIALHLVHDMKKYIVKIGNNLSNFDPGNLFGYAS